MSFVLTFLAMFGFWMLLSGELAPVLVIAGVVSSLIVAGLSHDLLLGKIRFGALVSMLWRLLAYLPWLIKEIVVANIDLVYRTLHPKMPIDPEVVEFNSGLDSDMGITVLANSITLTPGTITMEARADGGFTVHALTQGSDAAEMIRRVKNIEGGL